MYLFIYLGIYLILDSEWNKEYVDFSMMSFLFYFKHQGWFLVAKLDVVNSFKRSFFRNFFENPTENRGTNGKIYKITIFRYG